MYAIFGAEIRDRAGGRNSFAARVGGRQIFPHLFRERGDTAKVICVVGLLQQPQFGNLTQQQTGILLASAPKTRVKFPEQFNAVRVP